MVVINIGVGVVFPWIKLLLGGVAFFHIIYNLRGGGLVLGNLPRQRWFLAGVWLFRGLILLFAVRMVAMLALFLCLF
ncbi:hypothetical protein AAGG49_21845, partial [Stenotrophomonas maltophilia]|uniref:hypothetical protein n=1 Tax=Stenotrophomonas maltophilia TaxID=40324 RepID=UPI00313B378A